MGTEKKKENIERKCKEKVKQLAVLQHKKCC